MLEFIKFSVDGRLNPWEEIVEYPNPVDTSRPKIASSFWANSGWRSSCIDTNGLSNVGIGKANPRSPNDRIYQAFGSKSNQVNFVLAAESVNSVKLGLWSGKNYHGAMKQEIEDSAKPETYRLVPDSRNPGQMIPHSSASDAIGKWMTYIQRVSVVSFSDFHVANLSEDFCCFCLPEPAGRL